MVLLLLCCSWLWRLPYDGMWGQGQRPQQGYLVTAVALVLWAVGCRVESHSGHFPPPLRWQRQGQRAGSTGIPRQRYSCATCCLANSRATRGWGMDSCKQSEASGHGTKWQSRHDDPSCNRTDSDHCLPLLPLLPQALLAQSSKVCKSPMWSKERQVKGSHSQSPKRELPSQAHMDLGPREAG